MKKLLTLGMILSLFLISGCDKEEDQTIEEETITELEETIQALEESIAELQAEEEETVTEESAPEESAPEEEVPAEEPAYTGENFIRLTSPQNGDSLHEEPIEFTGTVSPNVEKIVVTAYYDEFEMEGDGVIDRLTDVYQLQTFEPRDETFVYRAKMEWDNLGPNNNDYIFTAYFEDGSQMNTSVSIFYELGGLGKPVIYLYPEEPAEVFINVEPEKGVFLSDPALNKGWKVIAYPDGQLYNLADETTYPYLFWEGYSAYFETPEEGFVVAQDELNTFFNKKLTYLGLNKTEIRDFKEYWLAELDEDPYYFIAFIDQATFEEYAPLTVLPEPDSIIRVFFDYKGLEKPIDVTEQTLTPGVRKGFTVTEWGGRLY